MTAYGMTKAATHHLLDTICQADSGLPENSVAIVILPITIDSAGNREAMPDADTSTWTDPNDIADALFGWANKDKKIRNGSKVKIETGLFTKNKIKRTKFRVYKKGHRFSQK